MERKKRLDAKRLSKIIASAALIVATILVFTGCSRQITTVKENQLKLQKAVQNNAQQIANDAVRIEAIVQAVNDIDQKQTQLQEQIVAVQNDNQMIRENMIVILKQLKEELSRIGSQIGSAGMANE